jgi:putative addiction module component (TIGR02574 family)
MSQVLQQAMQLSVAERLLLVQDLWDSIGQEASGTVSAKDIDIAQARLLEHQANPSQSLLWEEISAKLGID